MVQTQPPILYNAQHGEFKSIFISKASGVLDQAIMCWNCKAHPVVCNVANARS